MNRTAIVNYCCHTPSFPTRRDKKYLSSTDLLRLTAALDSEERTLPVQALRLRLNSFIRLYDYPRMYWQDVNFIDRGMSYRTTGGRVECYSTGEEGWQILLELLAARQNGESRIFPDPPGGDIMSEIRTALRKACNRAGLKGIDLATLNRSIKRGNSSYPPVRDYAFFADAEKQTTTTSRVIQGERAHWHTPEIAASVGFRLLPGQLRRELVDYVINTLPDHPWPQTHRAFKKGRNAAIAWFFSATMGEISRVAEVNKRPTYAALADGSVRLKKHDFLCESNAEPHVADILGLTSSSVKATNETVNFEAGFHLTVAQMNFALSKFYRINFTK